MKYFDNWLLDYLQPKPNVVDEALESFKNRIKKLYNKRDTSFKLKVKISFEKVCDTISYRWKRYV